MSGFYLTEAQRVNIYFPYLEIFYVFLTLSNPISLHSCSPALIYHSRTGSPSRVLHRSGIWWRHLGVCKRFNPPSRPCWVSPPRKKGNPFSMANTG